MSRICHIPSACLTVLQTLSEHPMSPDSAQPHEDLIRRIREDLMDSYDEELEMEIDDERMNDLIADVTTPSNDATDLDRRFYFRFCQSE